MANVETFLNALVTEASITRETDLTEDQLAQIGAWNLDDAVPFMLDAFASLGDEQDNRKIGVLIVLRALLSAAADAALRRSLSPEHAASSSSLSSAHLSTLLCVSLFLSELSTTTSDLLLEATANAAESLTRLSRVEIRRALRPIAGAAAGEAADEETRGCAESLKQELRSLRDALASSLITATTSDAAAAADDAGATNSPCFFGKRAIANFLGALAVGIVQQDAPLVSSLDFRDSMENFERSLESLTHIILLTTTQQQSLASTCVAQLAEVQRHLVALVSTSSSSSSNVNNNNDAVPLTETAATKLVASFLSVITRAVHKEQLQEQQTNHATTVVLSALRFPSVRRGMRLLLQVAMDSLARVLPPAAQQTVEAALDHCGGRVYASHEQIPVSVRRLPHSTAIVATNDKKHDAVTNETPAAEPADAEASTATAPAASNGKTTGGKGKKKAPAPKTAKAKAAAAAAALAALAAAEAEDDEATAAAVTVDAVKEVHRADTIDISLWNAKFKRPSRATTRADIAGHLSLSTTTAAATEEGSVAAHLLQLLVLDGAGGNDDHGADGEGIDDNDYGNIDGDEDEAQQNQQLAGTHFLPGVGRVSLRDLAAMVIGSLQQLPIRAAIEPGRLEKLHLNGIQESMHAAAKNAQLDELLRLKRQEELDVEEVPAGKLLTRVPLGAARNATQQSAQLLSRETARAALQRRIFLAVLKNFHVLRQSLRRREDEGALRAAQALTARVFAQLPLAVTDSALDVLCQCLRDEVHSENSRPRNPSEPYTVFSLVLQILYLKYSLLAPVASALGGGGSSGANPNRTGAGNAFAASATTTTTNSSGSRTARTCLLFDVQQLPTGISVENPVGWIASGDFNTAAAAAAAGEGGGGRKRRRTLDNDNDLSTTAGELLEDNFFASDNAEVASVYSHCLRRCITILVDSNRADWVLELLLQCPAITANVWGFLLQNLCLGERLLAPVGIYCVSILASKRRVYRNQAVSLLLFLCGSAKSEPRRLAIAQLAKLAELGILNEDHEDALVSYAVRLLARVPLIRTSKPEPSTLQQHQQHDTVAAGAAAAAAGEAAADRKAHAVLLGSIDRHMGLFLMLCAQRRHTKSLLPSLFNMVEECERQDNGLVASAVLQHPDLPRLIQQLLKHPHDFVMSLAPVLRRFGSGSSSDNHSASSSSLTAAVTPRRHGSEALVQLFLRISGDELRSQATSAVAAVQQQQQQQQQPGGDKEDAGTTPGFAALRTLEAVATILLTQAHALFMQSKLPVVVSDVAPAAAAISSTGRVLTQFARDIRYITPFLGLVARAELKHILVSLMQFTATSTTADVDAGDGYDEREVRSALRELLVKHPLAASMPHVPLLSAVATAAAGAAVAAATPPPRGLSLAEFVVQLHDAAVAATSSSSIVGGGGGTASASIVSSSNGAFTPNMLRNVLAVATRLTRTFDLISAASLNNPQAQPPLLLFDVKDALRAIQQLFRQHPISSNFMSTVDVFCRALGDHPELVYYTVSNVLQQFARDATWESDAALWRGVLSFCEDHWGETHQFVVNLPDRVLVSALRSNVRLGDIFRATYGSNPAFAHVMTAVSMQQ